MNKQQYQETLGRLTKKFDGKCNGCGKKTDDLHWRQIAPPEIRKHDVPFLCCGECLKLGKTQYDWWRGRYGR